MAASVESQLPPGFEIDPPHRQGGQPGHLLPPGFEVDAPEDSAVKQTLMAPVGAAEEFLKAGTSAMASVPAALAYAGAAVAKPFGADVDPATVQSKVHDYLTYQPHSNSGQAADTALRQTYAPVGQAIADKGNELATNVGKVSPTAETFLRAAPGAAAAASALVPAGAAVRAGVTASREATAAAAANTPEWKTAGYRSAADHPIAAGAAGESGTEALTLHNQKIGNVRVGSDVGVPKGSAMSQDALEQGAEAPNAVYNRTAASLPTAPLSPKAGPMVQNADVSDLVTHSPDAQAILDAQKTRLLSGPLSGDQVVNNMRALRQEGYARLGTQDVEQQNLGKAQLRMADGLEQHIDDTLPKNGPVSLEQLQDARVALAKNHAVRGALHGGNVDLNALGRMQQATPNLLTGELATAASFAQDHPRVAGLANHIEVPPSFSNDVGEALNSGRHHDVIGRLLGASGVSAGARRVLTGNTAEAVQRAVQSLPGSNASRFAPLEPQPPTPGNWTTGTGAGPTSPSPAGQPGQIPLSELLSHGIEQRPPQGLTAGPMGAAPGHGLPFTASPDMVGAQPVQGGAPRMLPRVMDDYGNEVNPNTAEPSTVSLGDRFARGEQPADRPASVIADRPTVPNPKAEPSLSDLLEQLSDYAKVKSQGVPEDIAARTSGPRTGPTKPWLVDPNKPGNSRGFENLMEDIHGEEPLSNNASGQTDVSQEFANWQSERSAAGTTRHRYDPTTEEMVPMHSTSARDPSSVKGRPVFDQDKKGKYTVVDRAGLSQNALNGIIARMTSLGSSF